MRFVVYGAGAIGGVVGGRLAQAGHEVVLIARGDHHDAIRDEGLRLVTPDAEPLTLSIPVVSHPAGLDFRDDDVVLMGMKSQHTGKALSALLASRAALGVGGVRAERRGQRARCAASVRRRVRRVRRAAGPAPRTGRRRGQRGAGHRHPRRRSLPPRRRDRAARRSRPRSRRPRSSRWRATTSCGGSTGSSSTTSATRSRRSAVPIPGPRRPPPRGPRVREGARGRRHRRGEPRGGCRPPR